jgi:hypothetical protein
MEETQNELKNSYVRKSASIAKLAAALSKAQGEIDDASKDSKNPFYKSTYESLTAVLAVVRPAFSKYGLAISQMPWSENGKVGLTSLLTHESGEWIESDYISVPKDQTPQGCASCITYSRRYTVKAIAGISSEDDDGNKASGKQDPTNNNDKKPNDKKPDVVTNESKSEPLDIYTGSNEQKVEFAKAAAHCGITKKESLGVLSQRAIDKCVLMGELQDWILTNT